MLRFQAALCLAVALSATHSPSQMNGQRRKPLVHARQALGPNAVSEDVGDIAVIVDNGLIATPQNLFDLAGSTVSFVPAGARSYTFARAAGTIEPGFGPALTFGYPGATLFPGDDDSQEVAFPAGFPFLGVTWTQVWVNTDGNVTFGAPEFASSPRDKARAALGPPRICAFLHDWNAFNALNPGGSGTIHAVVKTNPDRLVVTWNGVADFEGGVASTFQLRLHATGVAEVTFAGIDTPEIYGVVGIAEGEGRGTVHNVDLTGATQALEAGSILEAFGRYTQVSDIGVAREFYKTHPDHFDFLMTFTTFPVNEFLHSTHVSNQTHGIGNQSLYRGFNANEATAFDDSALWGSAGELEQFVFLNNINILSPNPDWLVNPPVEPYRPGMNVPDAFALFGGPVSLDGQNMTQVRFGGTFPQDGGETTRFYLRGSGAFYPGMWSFMSAIAHEVEHRWGVYLRFVHPTKGTGFDSFDLLGRDTQHWSFFVNVALPSEQFPDGPRFPGVEGNAIEDLGPLTSYNGAPVSLAPGQRVFRTPPNQLGEGFCALDQYLIGVRRASEVGPFWYVDEPESIYTGESLDAFDPVDPLNTSVTMRGWFPMGGIVFKGKRVDLTVQDIMAFEKLRERGDNPQGRRFWGPKGNLRVRYFRSSGRVAPDGDASITLSEADRELGDEADMIDGNGNPIDVKTMAFILLVPSGQPGEHASAIGQMESVRRAWQVYGNGPAAGGRGRFDTTLSPAIH